jgi:hypothetical protein
LRNICATFQLANGCYTLQSVAFWYHWLGDEKMKGKMHHDIASQQSACTSNAQGAAILNFNYRKQP